MIDVNFNRNNNLKKTLLIALIAIAGVLYIIYSGIHAKNSITKQYVLLTKSFQIVLPVEKLQNLRAMSEDTTSQEFRDIKKILKRITEVNSDARKAYLFFEGNGKIYFITDSELENLSNNYSPAKDFIMTSDIIGQVFFNKQEIITKQFLNQSGGLVRIMIPLKDAFSDKIVAVFGIDFSAKSTNRAIIYGVIKSLVFVVLLIICVIFFLRIISRNKALPNSSDQQIKASLILQESEDLYKNLFDNMLNGFAYCKMLFDKDSPADFMYLNVNKAFGRLTGLKDVVGKRASEITSGILEQDKDLLQFYGQVALTGKPAASELYIKSLQMWFMISAYCPQKEYFVTIFDVITKRKQIEEEMKINNFCLNALLELNKLKHLSLQHLYLFTLNKSVEMCRSEYGFFGFPDDTEENLKIYPSSARHESNPQPWNKSISYGSGLTDIWDEVIYQRSSVIANKLDEAQSYKKGPSLQIRKLKNYISIPLIDNERIAIILILCNKIDDYTETDSRQLSIFVEGLWNILKQRKYEDEIYIHKKKADESDFLKTAFLQNMSHEIRTPMNAIIGFSELLVGQYNNKTKLEYYAGIIIQRGKDLLQIISDILDVARIESGQLNVNNEECHLNLFFEELFSTFREHQKRIGKEQIEFEIKASTAQEELIILTDKAKLKQIFINLIGNAFKFTEIGKIEAGYISDKNNNIIFFVSDTGIGIHPEKHQMIFDRFTQVDQSNTRLYGGTGLGLTIAKGLVNLLKGDLWLESEPAKGTTFYFTISYKKTNTMPQETFFVVESEDYYFPDKTVLIVEDDPDNAEFLKEILADKGLVILHTGFAKEAVKIATEQNIDMILMDINLPDMDGYEATRLIKKDKPGIKIIAQTAYAAQHDRSSAIESGCDDYMSKPLKYELLLSMMKKHFAIE